MEWDVFEFSLLIIRFYKEWNGQVSCLEVSVKTKIQFCLKHYPNQAKWGRKHHQFFDPNLEVCLIHLCPVKTTTLWAWQGSCNQRKTSQQNRTEVQGTSFLHQYSSIPSVWWWIILYFADIQKEHRWNEGTKLNSSSLSPDIKIQVLPTSLYKLQ